MAEPVDIILPPLREMRTKRHVEVVARLEKIKATQVSFRQALSADFLLSRLITGDSQERVGAVERWVQDGEDLAS